MGPFKNMIATVGITLAVTACSENDMQADADSGLGGVDASIAITDATRFDPDAVVEPDAVGPISDAGVSDAMIVPPDAMIVPPDAMIPAPDAGLPSDFDITAYQAVSTLTSLNFVPADLSGITYNYDTDTFFMIRNNATRVWEVDTSYNLIRSISPTSGFGDTEDIVYLGNSEYAIVTEEGNLFIGTISASATTINPDDFQQINFAGPSGNSGPEGVAFDSATQTFYIVKEENPRRLYSFVRPGPGITSVTATQPYDAEALPVPRLMQDMSGVLFNDATGRLIILSHRDHRAVDIDLDGTVYGFLGFPTAQHEGIAFDGQGDLHIVAEPSFYSVYSLP